MRIVLVDDHAELRATVRRLLERRGDIDVVGEAADAVEALAIVKDSHPDVVLVDARLPGAKGSACTRNIKRLFPRTRVVAWSGEMASETEMFGAGADAFVLKGDPTDRLIEALRAGGASSHPAPPTEVTEGWTRT